LLNFLKPSVIALLFACLAAQPALSSVREVELGGDIIKFTSYLQARYSSAPSSNDSFTLPRLRIDVWSDPSPNWGYLVEIDPTISPAIVYGWIDLKASDRLKLRIGRFYYPFGLEYTTPPSRFDSILPATVLWEYFGYSRDIGAQVIGGRNRIKYYLSVVNGRDNEMTEDNDSKDFCGRVTFDLAGMTVGASHYSGRSGTTEAERMRTGGEVEFGAGPFTFKGEFISGLDGEVRSQGWYAMPIFDITPVIQALIKCESWDPDVKSPGDHQTIVTPGFNFFLEKDLKLQVNYVIKEEEKDPVENNSFLTQIQIFM